MNLTVDRHTHTVPHRLQLPVVLQLPKHTAVHTQSPSKAPRARLCRAASACRRTPPQAPTSARSPRARRPAPSGPVRTSAGFGGDFEVLAKRFWRRGWSCGGRRDGARLGETTAAGRMRGSGATLVYNPVCLDVVGCVCMAKRRRAAAHHSHSAPEEDTRRLAPAGSPRPRPTPARQLPPPPGPRPPGSAGRPRRSR